MVYTGGVCILHTCLISGVRYKGESLSFMVYENNFENAGLEMFFTFLFPVSGGALNTQWKQVEEI